MRYLSCFLACLVVLLVALVFHSLFSGPKIEKAAQELPAELPVIDQTPYQQGYSNGYRAFMAQMGKELPPEQVSAYTVRTAAAHADGEEADDRTYGEGYADGYHRATESFHCPRHNY